MKDIVYISLKEVNEIIYDEFNNFRTNKNIKLDELKAVDIFSNEILRKLQLLNQQKFDNIVKV